MITGEYLVLNGALSLAVPLKFGQSLNVAEVTGHDVLEWKTFVKGQHWFDAVFSLTEFVIGSTNDFPTAQFLREIFIAARELNPAFLPGDRKFIASSHLDFEINWGMGSSSSLIVNIAQWAGVDPFSLFRKISNGSGYDIAASMSDKPILYKLNNSIPVIKEVDFFPSFHENLYFAYLGKKKKSSIAVNDFIESELGNLTAEAEELSEITLEILSAGNLRIFQQLVNRHEKVIAGTLKLKPITEKLFSDFYGSIKSLGAWGGDFILLASDMPYEYVTTWLKKKDLQVFFRFGELVKSR
jgi:mevalonate kinase